ncbi:hypothetical protein SPI_08270 [Niveomyces insectorum RCEF 264]|uniref:Mss4-like protein n=1 Tax=Niveomyces insectorum RCEF 264 TaxID=1081102 RepID=A0A167NIF2_9HYPO|nr:hypothetical protein SPI_08270 [Niveomyces insectorum RCEF 264]
MAARTLRGGCQCGRNYYIVQPPPDAAEAVRLLFDPAPVHRASLASPLPTYLRVPLAWYHSATRAYFPDETPALIRRVYEQPPPGGVRSVESAAAAAAATTRRHFCGYCGTPLAYWSESPRTEAAYIRLALGSLAADDLAELDEWASDASGEGNENNEEEDNDDDNSNELLLSSTGLPWFDRFVEGSRLGRRLQQQQQQQRRQAQKRQKGGSGSGSGTPRVRHDAGAATSADGTVHVEWEVLEWTEGDEDTGVEDTDGHGGRRRTVAAAEPGGRNTRPSMPSPAKRARFGDDGGDDDDGDNEHAHEGMDVESTR